jgi:hypothetical protein
MASNPIKGSCLCGGVRFELDRAAGPFEICHCNRCRKVSGSQGMAALGVQANAYRLTAGSELITRYQAPLLHQPPAYTVLFCRICGSPVPPAHPEGDFLEIPAGLLDGDPGLRPDKHIFVEFLAAWDAIADALPRLTLFDVVAARGHRLPDDFEQRSHYDAS